MKESTLQRIRAKVKEKLDAHKHTKQDWYCGKFLVRGSNNRSSLDSFLNEKVEVNPYPGARMLSGWKHLNRFYKLCRKTPLVANLQKGKIKPPREIDDFQSLKQAFDQFWIIVYPCSFYVTITRSIDGIIGSHTLILWYSSSFRINFPIAVSTFDGHFNRDAPTPMIEHINNLRLSQKFFQSNESQTQQIPL